MKTPKQGLLLGLLASILPFSAMAAEYDKSALWSDAPARMMVNQSRAETANLNSYRLVQSAGAQLAQVLSSAPERDAGSEGLLVDLPLPNNKFVRFRMFSDSIMEPKLAAKFPQLKTYWGYDESDPSNRGRFDITERGFHGMFTYDGEKIFIDPMQDQARGSGVSTYLNYRKSDAKSKPKFSDKVIIDPQLQRSLDAQVNNALLPPTQPDGIRRSYRLAVATSGEYAQFHGGTVSSALSAVVTAINRVNEVYEVDLSVRLNLVGDNDQLIYTNASSDPYSNNSSDIDRNTGNLNAVIGSGSYDIGHIFIRSGGGVARLQSVCGSSKGAGLTGLQQPTGDPFYIDYVAHEIGHQFGGRHTFNGSSGSCAGGNRSGSAAYEPGSGATIMAYAGICDDENIQNQSDPYFHTHSITEINDFITRGGGNNCEVQSNPNNAPPTAEAGDNYTIPANTPFTLTGSASDANAGDQLTYVWEQYDLGSASSSPATMVDNGNRPIFRSFNPSSDPSRTFPNLDDILRGGSTLGVSLPTTNRDLNFRLTVRDQRGGVAIDDMVVEVSNTGSAFRVTSPSNNGTVSGGQGTNISWDVAGTAASPINCSSVDIDFSNNNGASFSTVASDIANDGSASVSLPNIATNSARVKIRCSDNIFFAISPRFNVEVGGPNQAPVFSSDPITKAAATAGSAYSGSLAGNASDPDGNPLSFSLNSGPAWLSVASNGNLSGTPSNADVGLNSFNVSVSDGDLSDSATLNIAVNEAQLTVGITDAQPTRTTTQNRRAMPFIMPEDGTLQSVSMYHSAGNGDMILAVYADNNGLPGARIATTAITPVANVLGFQDIPLVDDVFVGEGERIWLAWIYEDNPGIFYATGSPGRANINATWNDNADNMPSNYGNSTLADFRYAIFATYAAGGAPGNNAPAFNSETLSKANAVSGQAYSASIAGDASDADGDSLSFSKFNGPAWLAVGADGSLSGIPQAADVGSNTFTLEVSDGRDSDTASLTITVEEGAPVTADVGITTIGNSTSVNGARRAMPFAMPEAGTINSISIYHEGGPGDLVLAIYADNNGAPGTRLGTTGVSDLNASAGWQTVSLTSGVALVSGQQFWVAWILEDNPGIRYVTGNPGRAQSNATWVDGGDNMPSGFGANSQSAFLYSIYASYTAQ